ncbi:YbaB/EbfC family nucleoid-associated protein [Candidatus Rhabdochlamydia sp. T3358]|jgi:DNA-binding YbaB/EbfC family protein|uniref:YbaB/EbfC family nucleoid-associated protein n=1 Tax=Candidatus Rhabdochlamydia sp. T3358 TaxID=2099795 RepID=UPI0010B8F321|nr:YbaB/EbfC family nucleoid-associated protein [Candidatus Rhabdochlamydia sp. T3358]VHO02063.1 Nucleoid-associated protein [Candidatus Rhabdochlamydia sp. T3358]
MGSGYSKAKKQAKLMEQQLETMRSELQNKKVTGKSSADLVTVVLNGEKELLEIKIKPECLDPNDPEGLQDLIKAACEDGYQQLSSESSPVPFGF